MTIAEQFGASSISELRDLATRLRAMDKATQAPVAELRRLGL